MAVQFYKHVVTSLTCMIIKGFQQSLDALAVFLQQAVQPESGNWSAGKSGYSYLRIVNHCQVSVLSHHRLPCNRSTGDWVPGEYQSFGDYIGLRFGDILIPRLDASEPLRLECEHFLDCVKNGQRPRSDGRSGLAVVRLLEAATRSLEADGAPIQIQEA